MTPVEARLRRRIALTGPISMADYMAACLTDPDGYYARREPFGEAGDFVTAPEISQMFGELIGAWLVDHWHADGSPDPCDLVELGPGRGTLLADLLRVARQVPGFVRASRLVLVEASERLRTLQRQRLGPLHPRLSFADEVPTGRPLYLIANEFFDALPIRQFVRQGGRWHERTVDLEGAGEAARLSFALNPDPAPLALVAPEGAVHEVRPAARAITEAIAGTIAAHRAGAALIVDYGHAGDVLGSETLQAVRQHRPVAILDAPGTADLSAHVDFAPLYAAAAGAGAAPHGPVEQGAFLLALGLLERAGRLGADADEVTREALRSAVARLAGGSEDEMGRLFKVMAITAREEPVPGFPPPSQVVSGRRG